MWSNTFLTSILLLFLAQGGCGFIYKAKYGTTIVAAKEIITSAIDSEDLIEFEHEARMLTQMNHPNVLRVFGFCTQPADANIQYDQEHKYIVTEFAPNGSLEDAVVASVRKPFSKMKALEW